MRVRALGHAGLEVEAGASRVLIDPWFAPEGAFQASWFPFPDNGHLLDEPGLADVAAVLVSHEHLDHLDPWFLARVPAGVPIYVPRYPSPVLRRKLTALDPDRPVVEVDEWDEVEVAPGITAFFISEPPMNHDSAIVVRAGGRTLLDLNDARLFPVQLREVRARLDAPVDVLTFQGAGASWFPICYEYPAERRAELSRAKRASKFSYCRRLMSVVEPVVGIPFAGPPAFLDPELAHHNAEMGEGGIFPDQQQVLDWLATRRVTNTALLLPGDVWDADAAAREPDPRWKGFSLADPADRDAHIAEYAERRRPQVQAVLDRHPEPTTDLWPDFERYFTTLLGLNAYFNGRVGMRVGFEVEGPGGGHWSVDFRPGQEAVLPHTEDCQYHYRFASRWLPPLLSGEVPWEDFLLSLRFTARRDPDRYNDHLLGVLKFADEGALAAVEAFETALGGDDRIEVTHEGVTYRVQRHCPHAGNDLLDTGEVLPGGILRCLAHHYDFDLATGECLTGACAPLAVEVVDTPVSPPTSS